MSITQFPAFTPEEALDAYLQWVGSQPRLRGLACVIGFTLDGDAISTACGGQDMIDNPAYDRVIMRAIYNLERERNASYIAEYKDETPFADHEAKNGPLSS